MAIVDHTSNAKLRALLEEMTHDLGATVESHPGKVAAIAADVPHTIYLRAAPSGEALTEFNCVMYALRLVGRIEDPSGRPLGRWYADMAFLRRLIDRGVLKPCYPDIGSIVTWSSAEGLQHVGVIVSPGRAVSKWGIGLLYEHGLYEVPSNYGDILAFYSPLQSDDALLHLERFYSVP